MARRRNHAEHENHERWLVSYADFITLLFAFFVVMFASSQADKGKAKQVSQAVQEAFEASGVKAAVAAILGGALDDVGKGNAQMKGPGGAQKAPKENARKELGPALDYLVRSLQPEIAMGNVHVSMEPEGLVVSLKQAAFFPSGEDSIEPTMVPAIEKVAAAIRKLPNDIRLEGHTDSVPIHNSRFRSNWDLSAARSIAVVELLSEKFDVDRARLAIAGYAENLPVATNDTEEGRARNRRVDIVILNEKPAKR